MQIFDPLRRKYVVLTPEEWVRQHFVQYLIGHLGYPKGLISIERGTSYNTLQKRTDLCVYSTTGEALLLIECKAASVPLTQAVLQQAAVYNQTIRAKVVVVTNGLQHFCWRVDFETRQSQPLAHIPTFAELA